MFHESCIDCICGNDYRPDSRFDVEIYAKHAENRTGGLTYYELESYSVSWSLDLSVFTTSLQNIAASPRTPRIAVARLRNRVMSW